MNELRSDSPLSAGQRTLESGQESLALQELSVSGSRLLLALGFIACSIGALMWLFVRYWLFAP